MSEYYSKQMTRHIGTLLRNQRMEMGLTGVELGRLLLVSQQQISRYERGETTLTLDRLLQVLITMGLERGEINRFVSSVVDFHANQQLEQEIHRYFLAAELHA